MSGVMKNRILKWLKRHPKVLTAMFSIGLYLSDTVIPMGCGYCDTTGP